MGTAYQKTTIGAVEWPDDLLLSDEALENLKEAADTSCILCELEDLDEEE